MTRTAPRSISLENHKKKVPYEGRTRRSDRAGKTRTALLETCTAKSMRVNDKNNFFAEKVCPLQKWVMKVNIVRVNSTSRRTFRCRLTTPKALKESQHSSQTKKFTTFSEANNKQTGGQENNFSGWTVRWLTFGISNQSWGETSFSGKHQTIHRGSKARKPATRRKQSTV